MYFDHFENWDFLSFMTKVNPKNGNETKSDNVP